MGLATPKTLICPFQFSEDYDEVYALWKNAGDGIHLRVSDELDEIRKKTNVTPTCFLLPKQGT